MNRHRFFLLLVLILLVAACSQNPDSPTLAPTIPSTGTATPSPLPTKTITATVPPSPTSTPTPFLHPLSIEFLRQGSYPGSPITIEQTLSPGSNYNRYYVSYFSEGLKIYALMTIPNGETPETGWPVIIFNHGYIPPDVYRTTERYVAYVDEIAKSGYIVFRSDYRGHDHSEGEARGAYGNPDYTIDILNAVASMKAYPEADPNRIGMWGHSMGGYITLRSMVISDEIKVGVIWAGVVASYPDLISKWRRPPSLIPRRITGWRTSFENEYGSPEENPEFWNAISANSYLRDISGPIQLHHGTDDEDVPLEFSITLFQEMMITGKPVELYTYEGDNHNISNSFNLAMQRTVQFLNIYLQDQPQ